MPQQASRAPEEDESKWCTSDIVAMVLAMFDTIGPGLLAIAAIMIGISLIVTLISR